MVELLLMAVLLVLAVADWEAEAGRWFFFLCFHCPLFLASLLFFLLFFVLFQFLLCFSPQKLSFVPPYFPQTIPQFPLFFFFVYSFPLCFLLCYVSVSLNCPCSSLLSKLSSYFFLLFSPFFFLLWLSVFIGRGREDHPVLSCHGAGQGGVGRLLPLQSMVFFFFRHGNRVRRHGLH